MKVIQHEFPADMDELELHVLSDLHIGDTLCDFGQIKALSESCHLSGRQAEEGKREAVVPPLQNRGTPFEKRVSEKF